MSPSRIVCAWSSLSRPTNVRPDVRVTSRLPPCEPGMSLRPAAPDVPDVVRHPQPDQEHECEHNGGRSLHCSAPPVQRSSNASCGPVSYQPHIGKNEALP